MQLRIPSPKTWQGLSRRAVGGRTLWECWQHFEVTWEKVTPPALSNWARWDSKPSCFRRRWLFPCQLSATRRQLSVKIVCWAPGWGTPRYSGVSAKGHKAGMPTHSASGGLPEPSPTPSLSLATESSEIPGLLFLRIE